MGFTVLALLACFVFQLLSSPSCNQGTPLQPETGKVNMTVQLKKIAELERYEIFKSDRAAAFLIYGWVKFKSATNEKIVLKHQQGDSSFAFEKNITAMDKKVVLIYEEIKLVDNSIVSLYVKATFTDSFFHIYELSA
ncbi:uncharacterized protein KZ484_007916 [Pholidichthys leucotaenia]